MVLRDPTAEVRTSFSQPCAPRCDEVETSFWGGFERKAYVCSASNDPPRDLYALCDPKCKEGVHSFYTSCGVAPEEGWRLLVGVHALVTLLLAALPFRFSSSYSKAKKAA